MSISPPSDIVLDVARAADPARYAEAAARLTRTTAPAEGFSALLAAEPPAKDAGDTTISAGQADRRPALPLPAKMPTRAPDAYRGFEAMALASMIEAAMPDDGSVIFGKGTAGSVWKSMLAQQIAEQMAKAGGIGIATQLARGAQTDPASDAPAALTDTGAAAKSLLIAAAERRATATMMPATDDDPDSKTGSAT